MEQRTCAHCGGDLPAKSGPGRPRKFCLGCRRRRTYGPPAPPMPAPSSPIRFSECDNPECRKPMTIGGPGAPPRFCSTPCRSRWHTLNKPSNAEVGPRQCRFCGWTFHGNHAGHVFCSRSCVAAARDLKRGLRSSCDWFTVILWAECIDCGRAWPNTFSQRQRCPSCQRRHYLASKSKRNALRRGAPDASGELVSPLEVFERDGWVCQLCDDPVLPFVRWPHPRSASVDHVVPVSRGGQHVESNLQLAHLGCNSAKRDRVAA